MFRKATKAEVEKFQNSGLTAEALWEVHRATPTGRTGEFYILDLPGGNPGKELMDMLRDDETNRLGFEPRVSESSEWYERNPEFRDLTASADSELANAMYHPAFHHITMGDKRPDRSTPEALDFIGGPERLMDWTANHELAHADDLGRFLTQYGDAMELAPDWYKPTESKKEATLMAESLPEDVKQPKNEYLYALYRTDPGEAYADYIARIMSGEPGVLERGPVHHTDFVDEEVVPFLRRMRHDMTNEELDKNGFVDEKGSSFIADLIRSLRGK